jgi:hypothetical protein
LAPQAHCIPYVSARVQLGQAPTAELLKELLGELVKGALFVIGGHASTRCTVPVPMSSALAILTR